ncbi:ABC transporter substrate-binding protein [Paenibacillus sp. MMS18-CY102]|uniref:ABC transporter substrate-binding protein n=1 Tax=Paenibacillus sp. MMS18-CY102 TaxID=2682849 RepID=UPI001365E9A7|nr:ABC transporter substrate-binding protein [Paenibacillus sp. MMS18-CY102]MWC29439.1 ABC transporter substrate-binding protein [Paenibacillus sp. MMS18-CY102]
MFNKKFGKLSILLMGILILTMFLAACGDKEKASDSDKSTTETVQGADTEKTDENKADETKAAEPKVVTDAMGHQVTIPANPQKVLGSYLEDHLVALGVKPVAQWSVSNGIQDYLQTSGLEGVPTLGWDMPVEQVISLSPDLIIIGLESAVEKGLYDQYSKIAPTYVLGAEVNNNWRAALTKIGELLNKSDEAAKELADYEAKATEAKGKLKAAIGDQSAAVLWLVGGKFYIVDETRSSGEVLYKDLGMAQPNIVKELPADQKANWNAISAEKLAELDADHIFLINSDTAAADSALNQNTWKNLKAVKAGHLYELAPSSSWLYSGYIANQQIIDDALKALVK